METTSGALRGTVEDGVCHFRGIPYAQAPVGVRRFRPPVPVEPWTGVRPAMSPAPIAVQLPSPLDQMVAPATGLTLSEDCLALDVMTPGPDGGPRPVLVWIHGGAFLNGSGSSPWYDGSSLARRGDVVVVSINYRLGAFGFLHLADLSGDEGYAGSGNAGLLDQLAALAWVGENIAAFGGDPGNVTVFGESAGAMSIGALLGAPAARGRFRRAIVQSGAASNVHDRDRATAVARQVLDALGLGPGDADRLQDVPADDLLAAQGSVAARASIAGLAFQPVVDGTVLPAEPLEAVAAGQAGDVNLLAGTNRDEMRLFVALEPALADIDHAGLAARLAEIFGPGAAEQALATYQRGRDGKGAGEVWTAVLSDWVFRVPAVRLVERQAVHQPRTYLYLFTWASAAFGGRMGSCHALEIPFVFNTVDRPEVQLFTGPLTEEIATLARAVQDAWISFARHGRPGHPALPPWPAYDPATRLTMLLGDRCAVAADPGGAELCLWDHRAPPDREP